MRGRLSCVLASEDMGMAEKHADALLTGCSVKKS